MKNLYLLIFQFLYFATAYSQTGINNNDTLPLKTLDSVFIKSLLHISDASYIDDVNGMSIYAGKRTNAVLLSDKTNGLSQNISRTVLARIPGLTIWEMDGAGTQVNVGSRGTDPHRSIEMNMRQNGYVTNSDAFGYPENHYTVPMQAIEEVQLVRGSAALQFGPQFGGMMNYKIKQGDSTKPVSVESEQTVGSNNLFNSYNAVGGTIRRINYYTFYDNRHGNGWRDNAEFSYHCYYAHLGYKLSNNINIAAEFSRMDYVQQIAGGLTDDQFHTDARQSKRARNYFQPVLNIPALIFDYNLSPNTHFQITSHAILGQRNSVQFINAGNAPDTFNMTIGSYNPRQVDRDYYKGVTSVARILHYYSIGKINVAFSGGVRFFSQLTKRRQKGTGTTDSDFDLSLTKGYGIDLRLRTRNYALFAENIFQLSPKFSVTPGVRLEMIKTYMKGVINNATTDVAYSSVRRFPLFGAGVQYQLSNATQLYGNVSQAYRPYLYANVTPSDRIDKIDPSLKDSKGYNIDLGYRGRVKNYLQFDVNAFYLFYGNRIGLLAQQNPGGGSYLFTTNIGNSVAKGVEAFAELSLLKLVNRIASGNDIKLFVSLAYNDARYKTAAINSAGINKTVTGNFVENAPQWICKSGINIKLRSVTSELQYSYSSAAYNDAFNTITSSNGVIGIIPAYHVWDWNINWQINKKYKLSAAVNNLTDERYFNRRITFYPGPGILPADGRTFNVSFGIRI